jgi:hypothetical protein
LVEEALQKPAESAKLTFTGEVGDLGMDVLVSGCVALEVEMRFAVPLPVRADSFA